MIKFLRIILILFVSINAFAEDSDYKEQRELAEKVEKAKADFDNARMSDPATQELSDLYWGLRKEYEKFYGPISFRSTKKVNVVPRRPISEEQRHLIFSIEQKKRLVEHKEDLRAFRDSPAHNEQERTTRRSKTRSFTEKSRSAEEERIHNQRELIRLEKLYKERGFGEFVYESDGSVKLVYSELTEDGKNIKTLIKEGCD